LKVLEIFESIDAGQVLAAGKVEKLKVLEIFESIGAGQALALGKVEIMFVIDVPASTVVAPIPSVLELRFESLDDQMNQEGLITGQEHVVGRLQKLNLSESQ
jgi:hypothetical protein